VWSDVKVKQKAIVIFVHLLFETRIVPLRRAAEHLNVTIESLQCSVVTMGSSCLVFEI